MTMDPTVEEAPLLPPNVPQMPTLAGATVQQLHAELTRRFVAVALVTLDVSAEGIKDTYYTSAKQGIPLPCLAGCVHKLAGDIQHQAHRATVAKIA